jgi:hypothetical protein
MKIVPNKSTVSGLKTGKFIQKLTPAGNISLHGGGGKWGMKIAGSYSTVAGYCKRKQRKISRLANTNIQLNGRKLGLKI